MTVAASGVSELLGGVGLYLVLLAGVYVVILYLELRARRRAGRVQLRPARLRLRSGEPRLVHGLRCDLARGRAHFVAGGKRGRVALETIAGVEPLSWSRGTALPEGPSPAIREGVRRALATPLPPVPAPALVDKLVRHSLATKVGARAAASLDLDAELERALGLPSAVRRHLTSDPSEALAPAGALAQALGLRFSHHPGLPLALVDDERGHNDLEPRRVARFDRDHALAEPLWRRGLSAVLFEVGDPTLPWLEQLVPAGWLTLVTPASARQARPPDWTPVGAGPAGWLAPSGDRLLVPALDEEHAICDLTAAAARLDDALAAAIPHVAGIFTDRHREDAREWRAAIRACTETLRRAAWLTREFVDEEQSLSAGSGRGLRVLVHERRRTAAARLGELEQAMREIAALPGVATVRVSADPGLELVLELDVPEWEAFAPWIAMPLDPGRDPIAHRERPYRRARPEVSLGGVTAPYAEALGARRYVDAARILLFAHSGWEAATGRL